MPEFIENDAELMLSLEGQAVGSIANNLTTTVEGYALDARQGHILDNKKLDKSKVANNLSTIEAGLVLDARQGKWLYENTVGFDDIATDLDSDDPSKVMSAALGKELVSMIDAAKIKSPLSVSDGGTGASEVAKARENLGITPANIGAVSMKTAQITLFSNKWTSANWQGVSVPGVTATNTVIVAPSYNSMNVYYECGIGCGYQEENSLSFGASLSKPTVDLVVNVLILS